MTPRHARFKAPLIVLATLVGLWVGHTLEIWQLTASGVQFSGQVSLSPFGGVHNYMVAAGALLLVLSAVFGRVLWQIWWRLGQRLENARYSFRRLLRTSDASPSIHPGSVVPSVPARLLSLWLPVTVMQVLLYVMQENLESFATGRSLPGFGVLVGVHWAAPLIHGAVALVLCALIVLVTRKIHNKASTIDRIARAHIAFWRRLNRPPLTLTAYAINERVAGLAERFGADIWQRPPPVSA